MDERKKERKKERERREGKERNNELEPGNQQNSIKQQLESSTCNRKYLPYVTDLSNGKPAAGGKVKEPI